MCYAISHRTLNQSLEITSFNFQMCFTPGKQIIKNFWSSYAEIADNVDLMASVTFPLCMDYF